MLAMTEGARGCDVCTCLPRWTACMGSWRAEMSGNALAKVVTVRRMGAALLETWHGDVS